MSYFSEKQKFNQWWIWLLLLLPFIGIITSGFETGVNITTIKDNAIGVIVVLLIILFLVSLTLTTEINENGIDYKFSIFHSKMNRIAWDQIAECYVREYKPLMEYGGWGLRYSFKNGKAFNTSGNKGLQIVLKNNDRILLGTQKQDELEEVITKLKKLQIIK